MLCPHFFFHNFCCCCCTLFFSSKLFFAASQDPSFLSLLQKKRRRGRLEKWGPLSASVRPPSVRGGESPFFPLLLHPMRSSSILPLLRKTILQAAQQNAADADDLFCMQSKEAQLRKSAKYGARSKQGCKSQLNRKILLPIFPRAPSFPFLLRISCKRINLKKVRAGDKQLRVPNDRSAFKFGFDA